MPVNWLILTDFSRFGKKGAELRRTGFMGIFYKTIRGQNLARKPTEKLWLSISSSFSRSQYLSKVASPVLK